MFVVDDPTYIVKNYTKKITHIQIKCNAIFIGQKSRLKCMDAAVGEIITAIRDYLIFNKTKTQ